MERKILLPSEQVDIGLLTSRVSNVIYKRGETEVPYYSLSLRGKSQLFYPVAAVAVFPLSSMITVNMVIPFEGNDLPDQFWVNRTKLLRLPETTDGRKSPSTSFLQNPPPSLQESIQYQYPLAFALYAQSVDTPGNTTLLYYPRDTSAHEALRRLQIACL